MNLQINRILFVMAIVSFGAVGIGQAHAGDTVRVFILAGQSNMNAQADPVTYEHQFKDERTRTVFAHLLNEDGSHKTRDDVSYSFRETHTQLTVGVDPKKRFGPELGFGWVVGEAFDEPVLIIKTAWGGRSLYHDYRSPSAGLPDDAELEKQLKNRQHLIRTRNKSRNQNRPIPTMDDIKAAYGYTYRDMIAQVKNVMAKYETLHPSLKGKKLELAGFVWFQGYNDMINRAYVAEYADNLRHFVHDVRKDFAAPDLPVVIGQMGINGVYKGDDATADKTEQFKAVQAEAAKSIENATLVKTDVFWDDAAAEKYETWRDDIAEWKKYGNDHTYHYLASPLTIYRIGDALGKRMVRMLADKGASGDDFTAHPEAKFAAMTPAEIDAYERNVAANLKRLSAREIADLALVPPVLNTNPLPEFGYDRLDYGMTIGIARTPGGRIWSCWVAGQDGPRAFFVLNRSETDGETFSKPMLVINMHREGLPPRATLVGNLWTDPSGTLWLFFSQSVGSNDGRDGVWVTRCADPDADSPEWSKPRRICHGYLLSKPTIRKNGEWLLPIEFLPRATFPELERYRGVNLLVSTDRGETWTRRSTASFPDSRWVEPMVVELNDGRLWLLARTKTFVMQRFSSDSGRTWTEPTLPSFKHPRARFFIQRLASGRILLIKHGERIDRCAGRSHLTAWLSDDEGKTWRGGLMLDERTGISYPDGFEAPDGTLHVSYDRNRKTDGEILLARFTEQDVLARSIQSENGKLRIVVSRPQQKR